MDKEIVYVFIAYLGSEPKLLWLMEKENAMKICSDKRTSGIHFMLCWSTIGKIEENWHNVKWAKDDGRFNPILQELNIKLLDKSIITKKEEKKEIENDFELQTIDFGEVI